MSIRIEEDHMVLLQQFILANSAYGPISGGSALSVDTEDFGV